jgi:hypothetical protein
MYTRSITFKSVMHFHDSFTDAIFHHFLPLWTLKAYIHLLVVQNVGESPVQSCCGTVLKATCTDL